MGYISRVTQRTVLPEEEPIFSEMAFRLTIDDEGGGEFLVVESESEAYGKIAISKEDWPILCEAINKMLRDCREVKA
jgi:hypothetical protein